MRIPGIAGDPAKPMVAVRQRPERKFCHQHRAGLVQSFNHRGVFVDHLLFKSSRAPRCGITLHGQQILGAPRQPVQRASILSGRNFAIGFPGLRQRALLGQCDHEFQLRVVAFQPLQIHLRKCSRCHFSRTHQLREFADCGERQLLRILANRNCRRT